MYLVSYKKGAARPNRMATSLFSHSEYNVTWKEYAITSFLIFGFISNIFRNQFFCYLLVQVNSFLFCLLYIFLFHGCVDMCHVFFFIFCSDISCHFKGYFSPAEQFSHISVAFCDACTFFSVCLHYV